MSQPFTPPAPGPLPSKKGSNAGIFVLLAAVLAVTGMVLVNHSTPVAAPQTAVTVTATAPATTPATETTTEPEETETASYQELQDQVFDDQFTKGFKKAQGYAPNSEVIEAGRALGKSACDMFDSGVGVTTVMALLVSKAGGDKDMLAVYTSAVGVGVGAYCPQHISKLKP